MSESTLLPTDSRFKNLTGQQFGRWSVLSYAGKYRSNSLWLCRCSCGVQKTVKSNNLKSGSTRSCGCLQREVASENSKKHGKTGTVEFNIWYSMRKRCYSSKHPAFADYGGRGIVVCDRWKNSFENFLSDMGSRPSKDHSIEREDNDGNYCSTNCVWATRKEQQRNRRNNRILTLNGKSQCVSAWAEEIGIEAKTLFDRIRREWSVERALTTPVKKSSGIVPKETCS